MRISKAAIQGEYTGGEGNRLALPETKACVMIRVALYAEIPSGVYLVCREKHGKMKETPSGVYPYAVRYTADRGNHPPGYTSMP